MLKTIDFFLIIVYNMRRCARRVRPFNKLANYQEEKK